jgi:ESCRT-I complex subunit VPS28
LQPTSEQDNNKRNSNPVAMAGRPPPRYTSAAVPAAQQKIALFSTPTERRKLDDLSELYSTLRTTEKLEYAFARDAIRGPDEYTEACQRLIAQFKTTERALRQDGTVSDVQAFIAKYNIDCPRAVERLVSVGVPATTMHGMSSGTKARSELFLSAEATQLFITTMDAVKLNQRAVDELQPLLQDLVGTLNRAESLVPGFQQKPLHDWLVKLNAMRAVDELDANDLRQLSFDLENSYNDFMKRLRHE